MPPYRTITSNEEPKQFVTARKIVCDNHGVTVVKIDEKVFEDAQVNSVIGIYLSPSLISF